MSGDKNATKIAVIESNMKTLNKTLDTHVKDQKLDFDKLHKKIDVLVDKLEKKFAGKWVEKISVGALIGIIVGFVLMIVKQVGG